MSRKIVWLAAVLSTPSEGAEVVGIFGTQKAAIQAMDEHYAFDNTYKKESFLQLYLWKQHGLTRATVVPYELNAGSRGQTL